MKRSLSIILCVLCIFICSITVIATAETLPEEYAFIISEDYETFTLTYTGDGIEYEVISENNNIAQVGYVMTSSKEKTITVAGKAVKPGKTTFLLRDKNSKKEYLRIPVIVPDEDDLDHASSKATSASISILNNEIVKELINICPAISITTKETKEF